MRDEPAVVVEGLRVVRGGRPALDDLTLTVRRGSLTGLLGPNGSGKSTLMRTLVGVQRVERGRVEVLGLPAGTPSLRERVAYTTQAPSVYADLTVRENLTYFARVLGAPAGQIESALAAVALGDNADRLVGALSGGQRARASLASALVGKPDLLVVDEPTVGLDPLLRRDLWRTFAALARTGVTILVSSHVMDEADRCEDLLLLRDGRLLAATTPAGLRRQTGEDDLDAALLSLAAAGDT